MYKSFNQEIKTTVYSQPSLSTHTKHHLPFTDVEIKHFLRLLKNRL